MSTLEQIYASHASKVARLSDLLTGISGKSGLDAKEIFRLIGEKKEFLQIPAVILNSVLSPLEAVASYFASLGYSPTEIASLLRRHPSTIWLTLQKARTKLTAREIKKLSETFGVHTIPLSALAQRTLSVLESSAVYLQGKGLSVVEIAQVIGRNPRTVWTVLGRARKKGILRGRK